MPSIHLSTSDPFNPARVRKVAVIASHVAALKEVADTQGNKTEVYLTGGGIVSVKETVDDIEAKLQERF
jgi:hypothetical protein